jgi:uncharacterized repeat protein (TIGR01451 family)
MAARWLSLGMLLALTASTAGQPPPEIPENEPKGRAFVAPPAPSSIQPFMVPPTAPKSGPPLPVAPPAPAITMLVLVPQDAPPNQPIPYTIQVTNNSQADAGKVKVRMPLPEGTALAASDPKPLDETARELVWEIHSLAKGETKKIEVKLKVLGNLNEVQAKAYVSYEFGQAVKTRLSAQKLKVATELPKEATTADETIPVRVRVTNNGRVPVENVKLTETISEGFEFHRDADGETTKNPLVRTWELGTIPAGTGKTVEFRVLSKTGRDLLVVSNADSGGAVQHSHDGKVKIHDAKLKVELRGDPKANDEVASFKAVVKNEGSIALTNVKVIGSVPQDCKVTSRTNGGQITRDAVVWTIPKLPAGDSFLFKWDLRSQAAGRKTIRVEASSDRGLRDQMTVESVFVGTAALKWETRFESATVTVDKTGMFTVKVTNAGSEVAKNARLAVTLPPEVSLVQATPAYKQDGQKLVFDSRDVRIGGTEIYSITFRGEKSGQAYFKATLDADGTKPMNAEKYVQITTGR